MIGIIITSLVSAVWTTALSPEHAHPLSDEFIDYINTVQKSWTAGRNFHPNISMEYLNKLTGVTTSDSYKIPKIKPELEDQDELPDEFDARNKWPYCKESLGDIQDQGHCSSGWAMAVTGALRDRYCILSGGKKDFHFSAADVLTCSNVVWCNGCNGGDPFCAWIYFNDTGIVSGGKYNSSLGCKPYPYRNCNHYQAANDGYPDCAVVEEHNDDCTRKCVSENINYDKDLKKAKSIYVVEYSTEKGIRAEIYKHGPVTVAFNVFEDFLSYKKGVYQYTAGKLMPGKQTVKLIGWGVENNVPYWLAANSWNEHWGDQGFFKILRGEQHCEIEELFFAGIPML